MVKNKKAFTLVETLISMIIIVTVAIASVQTISKTKPRIEPTAIRGQYACWIWDQQAVKDAGYVDIFDLHRNGTLVQWYFDERSPREATPKEVDKCQLIFDQRPAQFYVMAIGAGNSESYGQLKTAYTPAISATLDVQVGKVGDFNATETKVSFGDEAIIAKNATIRTIEPSNIKSCKVVGGGATSCKFAPYSEENGSNDYIISFDTSSGPIDKIYGGFQRYASRVQGQKGVFNEIDKEDKLVQLSFDNVTAAQASFISANNNERYMFDNNNPAINSAEPVCNNSKFCVTLSLHDSSYINPARFLGFRGNSLNFDGKSQMTKMIESISPRRQSQLTKILNYTNPGAPGKNGAVLVLW